MRFQPALEGAWREGRLSARAVGLLTRVVTRQTEAVLLGADYDGSGKNLYVVDPVQYNPGDATAADEVMYSVEHPAFSESVRKLGAAGNLDRDPYDEVVSLVQSGTDAATLQVLDGANGEFTLEELEGGGQHLTFAAEEPNEPGNPSVEGEIWFAPDGSGTGTITFTQYGISVTFDITFEPDGTGYLTDSDGNTEPIG